MESNLRTVLENKELARIQEEGGLRVYSTQEILGSMVLVRDFAQFWINHKIDLQLIKATMLADYTDGDFTPEGKKGFKMALDLFLKFFENAESDVDSYILEAEKENRK